MKKAVLMISLVAFIVLDGVAVYRFFLRKSIPDAPVSEQVVSILQQNDCFVCHSRTPKLPFYANFPVIGEQMGKHVAHAANFINLEKKMQNPDEVTLSMLDHAVTYGTMPIKEYKMIHWGTSFNDKEKAVLNDWIQVTRAQMGVDAFQIIPESIPVDTAKVALGEKLYNDGRLSADGTISCATCHVLKQGGADPRGTRTSEGINGQFGGINAPTVYNAWYNVKQFWNGRAANLAEQAAGPPTNPIEMGCASWDEIVERLRADKDLVAAFEGAYPGEGITQTTVTGAIAEFEKTLLTPGDSFDHYLQGEKGALSAEALAGFDAFQENACATCHTGVTLGGKSFELLGIYGDYFAERNADIVYNADDDGLKGFTGNGEDLHRYKVPTLRNVALTAPYFHDGSQATLEEAVRTMAKYELGKELTNVDVDDLVAFMNSLTGKIKE